MASCLLNFLLGLLVCFVHNGKTVAQHTQVKLNPIVVIPGLGGSVLEAKLVNAPRYRDCATNSDWYTIWASLKQGALRYDCFLRNFELKTVPDSGSKTSGVDVVNATGVQIRPRDYGGTSGIEYSNAGTGEPPIEYMHSLVETLVKLGYVRNVTLRAATNDFRSAGNPRATLRMYNRLQNLVEDTSHMNGGVPVHLLSHSLGGPFTNLFLNLMSKKWKATYIKSHIAFSSPWLGTPVAIEGAMSGPMYDNVPQFLPELVVPVIRTFPSIIWMFPRLSSKGVNIWNDTTFVSTPTRNYSISNLDELVHNLDAPLLQQQWAALQQFTKASSTDPGVATLCIYANDTTTDLSIEMPANTLNATGKKVRVTWGDGTVSLDSLEHCKRFSNSQLRPLKFGGSLSAHTEIVRNKQALKYLTDWVTQ